MKKINSILWGIVLVAIGVILGLNALELTDISIFFKGWWTLFIIIPCFIGLFSEEGKTGNLIGLIIGLLLLLSCQDIVEFELVWKLSLPIVLIIFGISFMFKNTISNGIDNKIKEINKKSSL